MLARSRTAIVVALVVLAVLVAVHLEAQVRPPAPVRIPAPTAPVAVGAGGVPLRMGFQGLELNLRADKSEYQLGEPIVLYVTLSNGGTQAQAVFDYLDPETNVVQFLITKPGSATPERFLPYLMEDVHAEPVLLQPGESLTGIAKLFFGQEGWVFDQPGLYRIRATYMGRVESNQVSLTVVEGTGGDRTAGQLLVGSAQAGRFLYLEGGDHLTQGRSVLERISHRHGDTVLAGYANFALGVSLSEDFADFRTQRLREADLPGANRFLERSQLQPPGQAYFSIGLLGRLNRNHTLLGNEAQAATAATRLQSRLNELGPEMAPFGRETLLLHKVPAQLQLQLPPGSLTPRHMPGGAPVPCCPSAPE